MFAGDTSRKEGWIARLSPYLLGLAIAFVCFAFLSWGFAHLWEPYSPRKPESTLMKLARRHGWIFLAWDLFLRFRRRKADKKTGDGWWPARKSSSPSPASENAGAIQTHPAEATGRR
jgi:hypothetical protein